MRFIKKLLPRLPVCPFCGTIYRRGDIIRLIFNKSEACYHCGRQFKVKKNKLLFLLLELLILYVAADLLLINLVTTVAALYIINIVLVILGFVMIPYYIEFSE